MLRQSPVEGEMTMTAIAEYVPGTPSWVDLGSPDVAASVDFYGGLFGWDAPESVPGSGGYRIFHFKGAAVAGLGPLMSPDQPTAAWSTYVSVADADATSKAAAAAGASVLMAPMDVLDVGRMAIFLDPAGAAVSVWQPRAHAGAGLVNEPGTLCWNELTTHQVSEAKEFYGSVFGWEGITSPFGPTTYTEWKLDGRTVGGMIEMNEQRPAEIPSHWMVYFAVEDTDTTAAKAVELGGVVSVPPTDIPPGRFAVFNDSHGAVFSVIALADPQA
jgi:predicted enzyme related to lactoylglutathione lyase